MRGLLFAVDRAAPKAKQDKRRALERVKLHNLHYYIILLIYIWTFLYMELYGMNQRILDHKKRQDLFFPDALQWKTKQCISIKKSHFIPNEALHAVKAKETMSM